ncbi:MAG: hypothetical protein P1V97_15105, partial [Planctomycetota bacterium]|nr:hypothetical protein [Planctomycetota bacterium]
MAPVICQKCNFEQLHPPFEAEQMHCENCEAVLYIERETIANGVSFSDPFPVSNEQLAKIKARVELESSPLAVGKAFQTNFFLGTLIIIFGSGTTLLGFIGEEILYFPFFGGFAFLYIGYKMISSPSAENFVALDAKHLCISLRSQSSSYLIPLSKIEDWRVLVDCNATETQDNYQLLIAIEDDYPRATFIVCVSKGIGASERG